MYIRAYHLTYLRVLVLFGLLVLVVLFTGTIIYLYKNTFPLMKYMIVACGGLYIAFALSHPDTYIARYNLACARADVQTWMAEDVDTDDMEIRLIDLMQYDLQAGSADRTPAVFEFWSGHRHAESGPMRTMMRRRACLPIIVIYVRADGVSGPLM